MAMSKTTIDEAVARLGLPPGTYVATTASDDANHVVISDHATGSVVAMVTSLTDAATWCRAFNVRRLGVGWWAGRVVTDADAREEGHR